MLNRLSNINSSTALLILLLAAWANHARVRTHFPLVYIHLKSPLPFVMPVANVGSRGGQPSCFDRMKYGFMMGAVVGMASGALFGGFSALR